MTDYLWTRPTARKRHRCHMCRRVIMPGEDYDRMAGLDGGDAWTYKSCRHCYRAAQAYGEYEWDEQCIIEWLDDCRPDLYASLLAGWRYPDGELVPLPFSRHCHECRTEIPDDRIWCQPCDVARIERLSRQLEELIA